MGIILSALGGGAEVLLKDMEARQKVEDEKNLYNYKSGIELEKAKTLEQFRAGLSSGAEDQKRQKMADAIAVQTGIILNGRNADTLGKVNAGIASPGDWTPEMQAAVDQSLANDRAKGATDPRIRSQAAVNAGYIDEALKLDKIAEGGASNVPWGATRVNADGEVLYDNGSALKGGIEKQKADTGTARAAGSGRAKPMDPVKADAIISRMEQGNKLPPNPFADPMAEKAEDKADFVGKQARSAILMKILDESGDDVHPMRAIQKATADFQKLDKYTVQAARDTASKLYEKGKYSAGDAAAEKAKEVYGVDPRTVTSNQFSNAIREKLWDAQTSSLNGDVTEAPKSDATPAKASGASVAAPPADAKPSPPPAAKPAAKTSGATYAKWMAAVNAKKEILSNASNMSADRKESYLRNRLPDIEREIEANKDYVNNSY